MKFDSKFFQSEIGTSWTKFLESPRPPPNDNFLMELDKMPEWNKFKT